MAANPLHTPALYSGFLRALVSAKLDNNNQNTNRDVPTNGDASASQAGYQSGTSLADMPPPSGYGQQHTNYGTDPSFLLSEFQFESEMGPVADMSTFPPTMAPNPSEDNMGSLTMDNILSSGFWDSVLVPGKISSSIIIHGYRIDSISSPSGYNSMDGLSGGFVFGAGGSGLITPRIGGSPMHSGNNTPARGTHGALTQMSINAAFDNQLQDVKVDAS
jgi:hypothetical protein